MNADIQAIITRIRAHGGPYAKMADDLEEIDRIEHAANRVLIPHSGEEWLDELARALVEKGITVEFFPAFGGEEE